MEFSTDDYRYMSRALHLAERGRYTTHPNPNVGCVLVKDSAVVGEGWHEVAGGPHAEIMALRMAGAKAAGATAYVTLEPCCHHGRTPPCTDALLNAGVNKVIAAMEDPNHQVAGKGLEQLRMAGVQVASGLMSIEAEKLNLGYLKRRRTGRPFVRLKLAMSLDGRTAMASGESKWITTDAARQDVQRLRAESSAILTGVGTVLADDPAMTVRLDGMTRQPLRVVLDTNLSLPETARMLREPGETLLLTCSDDDTTKQRLQQAGATIQSLPFCGKSVDLDSVLDVLGDLQINDLLVETGATLSGAFVAAGLVDEFVIYMAPILMGDAARGLFRLPGLEAMADKLQLEIMDVRAVGKDWRITAKLAG